MQPSEKFGVLGPWEWILNLHPAWAFCAALLISPVGLNYLVLPLIEGRILCRRDKFVAFQCDALFAPAVVSAQLLVREMDDRVYLRADDPIHWMVLAAAICMGVAHYIPERKMYSWRQMTSPSKIYHELLFPFFGYLLIIVGIGGFICAPTTVYTVGLRLVFVACMAAYLMAWPLYDEKHKHDKVEFGRDRYWFAHVEYPWPWQHRYTDLGFWWRRYIADWRRTPARLRTLVSG